MAIVVDTCVLIDHLRDVGPATGAFERAVQDRETLVASVVTNVEILRGVLPGEERATRRLLNQLEWITVDDDLAEQAGELARRYRRSHQGIGTIDMVIAATAQHLGADLWTTNVRHFPMFPDLQPPY